jgi:repressor LexA
LDKQIFVQNIKMYCQLRGVKPTIACRESGAGTDLINQLERRGSVPSVERVQLLAQYLGVTTSELLGETGPKNLAIQDQPYLVMRYNSLPPKVQEEVMAFIEFKVAQQLDKK